MFEMDFFDDDNDYLNHYFKERMPAISHALPTRTLIWLPTCPALASTGSGLDASASSAAMSMTMRLDEPETSSTIPIIGSAAASVPSATGADTKACDPGIWIIAKSGPRSFDPAEYGADG